MKIILIFFSSIILLYANISTEVFSRWNINYGDLLVDQGKYLEAYEAYESAITSTNIDSIKIEARLKEANILTIYLDEEIKAINIYRDISKKYPNSKESEFALYQACMIAKDVDEYLSLELYDEYMTKYRNGKFYFQVKFLKDKLDKKMEKLIGQKPIIAPKKVDKVVKKLDNIAKIRVLLHKKISKVTLKGNLNINNQNFSYANFYSKKNGILFNNKLYKSIDIYSNKPINIESKKTDYRGFVRLIFKDNKIRVINVVDIESYIYGVVTSESISSWKLEALKSQATASRTFAYFQSQKRKSWTYDVLDNTGDQVYKGIQGEHPKGIKATNETKGIIITYKNSPIYAQYTANSGWISASSSEIFNINKPYLYGHEDSFSKKMPLGTWMKKVSISTIESKMAQKGVNIGSLIDIKPYKVGKSGRVLKVKFIGSKGSKILRSYTSIRRFANLRDILMTIEKDGNNFYFKGGGFGHGVGYSQWGGQSMAKAGYKYDEILKFYYRDITLEKLW
jgi:stage II sporulation protein D